MRLKYSSKSHGYWLDGKRCKSPSAVAKVPDDSSALDYWRRRQTAIGLALQPHLLTAVAASADDKKTLDAICEEAMAAAGANSGRDFGTAVHKITDLIDGGVFVLETPEVIAIRETWRNLLDSHDLEIVASEQVIVHPSLMIAGRFDRVVRHRLTGDLFIADTKTGASADKFLQSHAVQLALYARAELRADGPAGDADFEVSDFTPMLPVRTDVALVLHLPADGEASVIPVDIDAGWRCFTEVIQPTWAWRNRADLRVDNWQRPAAPTLTDRAANLIARLRTIAEMSPEMAQSVRASWPAGVPKLSDGGHTDDDFDRIEHLVADAEDRVGAPFAPLPAEPAPLRTIETADVALRVFIDEGGDAGEGRISLVREMHAALTDEQRSWIATLAAASRRAGASFHLADRKTMRAARIVRGLCILAANDCADDDLVRALAAFAIDADEALHPSLPTGAAIATMSAAEAATFVGVAEAFVAGRLDLRIDDNGVMRIHDRPITAEQVADRLGGQVA